MSGNQESKRNGAIGIGSVLVGLVLGLVLTAGIGWTAMPRVMLQVHQSRYPDVDQTCTALKTAIEAAGWHCPAIRNMNRSMGEFGLEHDRSVRIVELCRADYAHAVLADNPEVSTLMPCAFGVYEGSDGKVYISGMNTGLMGTMFGGRIAEVMGTKVARDEKKILETVIVH